MPASRTRHLREWHTGTGLHVATSVIIDTSTGYFTARFEITITSVETFQIDGKAYRLGHADVYALHFSGKLTATAPPSAYIAGATDGGGGENVGKD